LQPEKYLIHVNNTAQVIQWNNEVLFILLDGYFCFEHDSFAG